MEKINKYPGVEADSGCFEVGLGPVSKNEFIPRDDEGLIVGDGIQARDFNSALKRELSIVEMEWQEYYQYTLYYRHMFNQTSGLKRNDMGREWSINCVILRKISNTPEKLYHAFKVSPLNDTWIIECVFRKWLKFSSRYIQKARGLDQQTKAWEFSPYSKVETEEDLYVRGFIAGLLEKFGSVDNRVITPVNDSKNVNNQPEIKPDDVVAKNSGEPKITFEQATRVDRNSEFESEGLGQGITKDEDEPIATIEEAKKGYFDSEPGSELSDYFIKNWINWAESEEQLYDILGHLGRNNPWKKFVLVKLETIRRIDLSD